MGYCILFVVPAEFHGLGSGICMHNIEKLMRVLRTTAQTWHLCEAIRPKLFIEPLLRRLGVCRQMTEIGM